MISTAQGKMGTLWWSENQKLRSEGGGGDLRVGRWFRLVWHGDYLVKLTRESCELCVLERWIRREMSLLTAIMWERDEGRSSLVLYLCVSCWKSCALYFLSFLFLFFFTSRLITPTVYIYPKSFPCFYNVNTSPFSLLNQFYHYYFSIIYIYFINNIW